MNQITKRIVFMGTPEFAKAILEHLVNNKFSVVGVVTAADKPAGRGKKITSSEVKKYATVQGIPVLQPTNLQSEEFLDSLKSLQPDLIVVVAFRMLPKVVWSLPKHGTINLHASLLPAYRGAAPINWAIIQGEKTTGVTTFFIDDKIDTGAILYQSEIPISDDETAGTLHDKLMTIGKELVEKTILGIIDKSAIPQGQPKKAPTHAPKLYKHNCQISWDMAGKKIEHFIRGLSPYPGAWTLYNDVSTSGEFKILNAKFHPEVHNLSSGSIQQERKEMKIAVLDGWISVLEIQFPGKKNMKIVDFLNGFQFLEGAFVHS